MVFFIPSSVLLTSNFNLYENAYVTMLLREMALKLIQFGVIAASQCADLLKTRLPISQM